MMDRVDHVEPAAQSVLAVAALLTADPGLPELLHTRGVSQRAALSSCTRGVDRQRVGV